MRTFIAGATGVLGRRLVSELASRGHEVVGLARSDDGAALVERLGGTPARPSLFDSDALARAAEGAEVVIHAATAILVGAKARWKRSWAMNDRIRTEGTRALTEAAGAVGARRYLQQSVVWVVKDPRGPYDEDTPPDPPELVVSAVEGEEIAREAGERAGFEVGVLRCGAFYGADTDHSRTMARLLLGRRLPVIGRGGHTFAPIHADDAAGSFAAAAEANRADGTWHVVDDGPLPAARYFELLADALGAPRPRRVPTWIARLLLGRRVVESLTTPMDTTNARARRELGWAPRFSTCREGFVRMVERWRNEGFVPEERGSPEVGEAAARAGRPS